jgi:hypothetical protein
MSEESDDFRPKRMRSFVFWLNVAILVAVGLWAACLPFGFFYSALNEGNPLPRDFANYLAAHTWVLVGPFVLLNVVWLIYAARRWRERPVISEPPRDHFPEQSRSPHIRAKREGEVP